MRDEPQHDEQPKPAVKLTLIIVVDDDPIVEHADTRNIEVITQLKGVASQLIFNQEN